MNNTIIYISSGVLLVIIIIFLIVKKKLESIPCGKNDSVEKCCGKNFYDTVERQLEVQGNIKTKYDWEGFAKWSTFCSNHVNTELKKIDPTSFRFERVGNNFIKKTKEQIVKNPILNKYALQKDSKTGEFKVIKK